MKKFLTILFTLYFTTVSLGIPFSKHYCGNTVSKSIWGVKLGAGKSCGCNHKNTNHKKKCCKSETTVLKTDTQKFQASSQYKLTIPFEFGLLFMHTFELINYSFRKADCSIYYDNHAPPEPSSPIFILHRKLLI